MHCIYVPHLLYPFICRWTFRLVPCPGYCKQCCNEHCGTCLSFFYLFLAVLGLCFCARAFSSCGERGPLFIAVSGPLTIAASLVAEHRLQTRRLSSCGSWAQLLCGMWDLPRPGLEPVSLHWQADSQPLHHQGSPTCLFLNYGFLRVYAQ